MATKQRRRVVTLTDGHGLRLRAVILPPRTRVRQTERAQTENPYLDAMGAFAGDAAFAELVEIMAINRAADKAAAEAEFGPLADAE